MKNPADKLFDAARAAFLSFSVNRLEFAKCFYELDQAVVWKNTEYKSLRGYIDEELQAIPSTVSGYLYFYRKAMRLGYTYTDLKKMVGYIGFTKTRLVIINTRRKLKLETLVKEARSKTCAQLISSPRKKVKDSNETFLINLPKDYAIRFAGILHNFGMKDDKQHRVNLNLAMQRWLDTL